MTLDAVDWIEHNFYVPDARDPVTGAKLGPGPIRLAQHQKKILRHATSTVKGRLQYATVVYSAPKKSGKTRIGAAVAAWFAKAYGPYNEIYCAANDGKQSSDRILAAVKQAVKLAIAAGSDSPITQWYITKPRIELPDGTFIEAIPCDPSGQAGANPGLTVWSEMWGYRHEQKERLWAEMTIPPTRWGESMRWVESYAGYTNESHVLEHLYRIGVSSPLHPSFKGLPVHVNKAARMLFYWDREARMPWQTPEYYAEEAKILRVDEFRRLHKNEWVDPVKKAFDITWWDACEDVVLDGEPLPKLDKRTPVVLALDAAVSHDCCAAVAVSRHPKRKDEPAVRAVRIWEPPIGDKIDLSDTMERYVVEFCSKHNVVCVPYDEYQLHKMCGDLRKRGVARFLPFSQGAARAVADKQLFEHVIQRQMVHGGDQGLRQHADNAAVKDDGKSMRFVKMDTSQLTHGQTAKPIDALIATSMGVDECLRLNLG